MNRFLCVHGHFYQPPRENPWTGRVEREASAAPFHDWNERIAAECYGPNADNYPRMSFNFGPTLLSWLESQAPEVYRKILRADRDSRERFSGHGSALAQAYGHMILPLARPRDKRTQVFWGIRDFEHRFGRSPEGMWLPETAVDSETLEVLAELGLRFTILAPHQALQWRQIGEEGWQVAAEGFDTGRAYEARLPSGARIALFFYDGAASHAIAFGGLVGGAGNLTRILLDRFTGGGDPQIVSVATDGETYGHHFRGGDRVLSGLLARIEEESDVRLTNYAEYLAKHPPRHEVWIREKTSWSCTHGVGRWKEECGCTTGEHPGWRQAWRAPLKEALDSLRDELDSVFEEQGGRLLRDPWAARDDSIELVLAGAGDAEDFLARHAGRRLDTEETSRAINLFEMQRCAMSMFTSCGWFFEDPSGLETRQVLRYAARAMEIAEGLSDKRLEEDFLRRLEAAVSNDPAVGNARRIYEDSRPKRGSAGNLSEQGSETRHPERSEGSAELTGADPSSLRSSG
jgi:alpha-amylase/alpha-mannosidase (GH57 family)